MGATPWTELSITETGWIEGFPDGTIGGPDDLYVDVLFEGTLMGVVTATSYTALSLSGGATPTTELTTPSTTWTELTG